MVVVRVGAKPGLPMWCTPSFRHFLLEGKSQLLLREPEPAPNLVKLVDRILPGYVSVMPYEYQLGPLLRGHANCVDLAFLEAVWRYSKKVGQKRFPCGDFTASPSCIGSASEEVADASKVGASSSSSSSSKPAAGASNVGASSSSSSSSKPA